jgi:hypothetical protein
MVELEDKTGAWLDGGKNYHLRVPTTSHPARKDSSRDTQ